MFQKKHRLELRHTLPYFTFDHKTHQQSFSLYWRFNEEITTSQAAVVVSKKTSPTAVGRNRLKRVIRATVSSLLHQLPTSVQLVIVVKNPDLEQKLELLQQKILEKIKKPQE